MIHTNLDRHTFALHFDKTSSFINDEGKNIILDDKTLYHRIVNVLRFSSGSQCILFDKNYYAEATVQQIQKKKIELYISKISPNTSLSPSILLLLPILKRQALSEAIYMAVEAGVNEIQLILTHKVQRSWAGDKELERLQAVVIAACEQAKYFDIPKIKAPISLEQSLSVLQDDMLRVYYDADGASFADLYEQGIHGPLVVLIGPEGDLTQEEKTTVKNFNFTFTRLTPTILRAPQAVSVGISILRTLTNHL